MLIDVNMEERLQKIIANAGLMSRRKAEETIKAGLVTVNGIVAELGSKADPDKDTIKVDGVIVKPNNSFIYIMLNKPVGYVCTLNDEKGRKIVTDLVDIKTRVFPVGRLDYNSEGLLLLTNDGDFANRVMHPSDDIEKTYYLKVRGTDIHNQVKSLKEPIKIDGYLTKCADVQLSERIGNDAIVYITIKEGRNRQIRQLCERAGLSVLQLKRIQEGPLALGDLKPGKWRYLTHDEVSMF